MPILLDTKQEAAKALKIESTATVIVALPKEDRAFVRYMLACCLRRLGRPTEAEVIYREVANGGDDEFVRREAAFALGEVGDWSSTSRLVKLLRDDKILEVRSASAIALGKIGNVSAVEPLNMILKKKPTEDDEFLRRSAARSIGEIARHIQTGRPLTTTPQNFLPEKYKEFREQKYPSLATEFPAFRDRGG